MTTNCEQYNQEVRFGHREVDKVKMKAYVLYYYSTMCRSGDKCLRVMLYCYTRMSMFLFKPILAREHHRGTSRYTRQLQLF